MIDKYLIMFGENFNTRVRQQKPLYVLEKDWSELNICIERLLWDILTFESKGNFSPSNSLYSFCTRLLRL